MSDFLKIAVEAAKTSGNYLMENKGKITFSDIDEKARNDFVTHVDRTSEKMIVDTILSEFPDHRILAEEGTFQEDGSEFKWIIDPLDGTKNFIQNIPVFCISIALQKGSDTILGVIYDPVHDELFSAEKNNGAYLNAKEIRVSPRGMKGSIIATGFPFKSHFYLPQYLQSFNEVFLKCSGMRRLGSAAMDLCYTACGKFTGFFELGLSPWDIAAGSLIVQEAGGIVTDFWGKDSYLDTGFVLAGNCEVQKELLKIIRANFPEKP